MIEFIIIAIVILVFLSYIVNIIVELFNYDDETERIFKEYEDEQQCDDNYIEYIEILKDRD